MLRRLPAVGRFVGLLALPMAVALACASPTLPLPPPEAPEILAGMDADHVELVSGCGGAEDDAMIYIVNQNLSAVPPGAVARATDCGAWNAQVYAHKGDVLDITQEYAAEPSLVTSVLVN
jgi:hypothetical protein